MIRQPPDYLAAFHSLTSAVIASPPSFFQRIPFGYHDKGRIDADLRAAGFRDIAPETVGKRSRIASAHADPGPTGQSWDDRTRR